MSDSIIGIVIITCFVLLAVNWCRKIKKIISELYYHLSIFARYPKYYITHITEVKEYYDMGWYKLENKGDIK